MGRTLLVAALTLGLAAPVFAQEKADLTKSGSFDLQTGLKFIGETTQVAEKHTLTAGKVWGVSFNVAGKGPLHMAPLVCTAETEAIEGTGTGHGKCAWTDTDGDQLFVAWSSNFSPTSPAAGEATMTTGTGKFAGIQGKGPFHCTRANANGQSVCMQHFEYRLPPEVSGSTTGSK